MKKKSFYNVIATIKKAKAATKVFIMNEDGFMNFPVTLFGGASPPPTPYVNSVQQVSITIAANSLTGTATISAVGANAFLVYQGFSAAGGSNYNQFAYVQLTNSTTVTATLAAVVTGNSVTINACVVDPMSNLVDTVQQGTIAMLASTSATATITGVDLTRSAVFYLGHVAGNSTGGVGYFPGVTLTNTTTVTASTSATSAGVVVAYVVVQFKAAAIQSIQQFSQTPSGSANSITQTISSVNINNSMIAYGNMTFATSAANSFYWGQITNSTTVTFNRRGTAGTNVINYTIVEFKSGVLKNSIQRGNILISSGTSGTATITSVSTTKTLLNYTGISNSTGVFGAFANTIALTNATTITATHAASASATIGYEAVQFN